MNEERQRKLARIYRCNYQRWNLQIGDPFLLMLFVHPLAAVIFIPFVVHFVPPVAIDDTLNVR